MCIIIIHRVVNVLNVIMRVYLLHWLSEVVIMYCITEVIYITIIMAFSDSKELFSSDSIQNMRNNLTHYLDTVVFSVNYNEESFLVGLKIM